MEDDDDDFCVCDQPEVCTCIFEMDWMRDLLLPLARDAYAQGFEEGVHAAIHDTIYGLPISYQYTRASAYAILPDYAYLDPCRYQRVYDNGFQEAYTQVYRRHAPMLDELRLRHLFQDLTIYLLSRFSTHPLMELRFFPKIEKYIWPTRSPNKQRG